MKRRTIRYEDTAREIVLDAVSQHTGIPVSAGDRLDDFHLDSLERTDLLIELEDSCDDALQRAFADPPKTRIDDREYHKVKTVEDLVQIVAYQLQKTIAGS